MLAHLEEKSERCKQVVLASLPRLPLGEVHEIDAVDALESRKLVHMGRKRVAAFMPALRMEGPLTRVAVDAGIRHDHRLRTASSACYLGSVGAE